MDQKAQAAARRLSKELAMLRAEPPGNICAGPVGDNLFLWKATLFGPEGTPYEGGVWEIEIRFSPNYPIRAPEAKFLTKMWHPNISFTTGSICLDILGSRWSPALTIESLLVSLCSMLDDPNPNSPLNSEAASMFKADRARYERTCRDHVRRHAAPE